MNGDTMIRKIASLAALLALTFGAVACAQDNHDGHDHLDDLDATSSMSITPPSLPYPTSLGVDATNAEDVALAAVRAMYGWRFTTDTDPRDAVDRAVPLLNAALAAQLRAIPPEPFINYRLWDDWHQQSARTTVTAAVGAEEHPDDTTDQWHRKVATRIEVNTPGGKTLHQWSFAVLITTQKQAGQWLVAQFQPLGLT